MATAMNGNSLPDNKYENNMVTYISLGNFQFPLPDNILVKTMPDGRVCLSYVDKLALSPQKTSEEGLDPEPNNASITTLIDTSGTQTSILPIAKLQKSDKFMCQTCNMAFNKIGLYKKHVQNHRNMKKFKCDQCYESFNVEDNYKIHAAMHTKGQPTCPICNRKFQRLASLKAHLLIHRVDETYTCEECLAEFERGDDYLNHMEKHHSKNEQMANQVGTPHICSFCNYSFEDIAKYKEHIACHIKVRKLVYNKKHRRKLNTRKDFPYKCLVCDKSFQKVCLLERHMRTHNGEKPFVCPYCKRGFAQKGTLQIHLIKHTGQKPFKCYLCPAKFCQKGNLRIHVERAHTAPTGAEKLYTCTHCTCIFKKLASLNAHITRSHNKTVHDPDVNSEVNEVIDKLKEVHYQSNLLRADSATSATNSVNYDLPNESIKITDEIADIIKDNEKVNYTTIHSSIDGIVRKYVVRNRKIGTVRWYICSFCSKEFKKPSDLIRHIRTHTKEKPFKCPQCDATFTLKSTLVTHIKTHFVKKDHVCVLCSKDFTSSRSLSVHLRKHDKNTVKKQYKCSECNKIFASASKAKNHMAVHDISRTSNQANEKPPPGDAGVVMKQPLFETMHGYLPVAAPKPKIPSAELEQYKNRPFKCPICTAAFTRPVHLKRHSLIHTGEKKFKCDNCAKTFYTAYALKEHVNFHKGIKNFTCKICNKKFVTSTILKRHLTMHTTLKPYVCPYCKKRFKSVTLCRRHINIHKRDLSIQIQALAEPAFVEGQSAKIIDFTEALSDNVFALPDLICSQIEDADDLQDDGVCNQNIADDIDTEIGIHSNGVLDDSVQNANLVDVNVEKEQIMDMAYDMSPGKTLDQCPLALQGDDYCNIIATTEDSTNTLNTSEDAANVDVDDQNLYSTIYVNCDNLQVLSANDYNALLSQMKGDNNESLLLNSLHGLQELHDPNMFFPLTQINDFAGDSQHFDVFNSNLILNSINELNANSDALVEKDNEMLNTIDEITASQFIPDEQDKLATDSLNLTDNLIIFNDNNANKNALNNDENQSQSKDDESLPLYEPPNFICAMCKCTFKSLIDMENHECLSLSDEPCINGAMNDKADADSMDEDMEQIDPAAENTEQPSEENSQDTFDDDVIGCEFCDKTFTTKSALFRHLTVHNYKKSTKNVCSFCEKIFKKPSDLQRHIRIHTGEKPYRCEKCNKSFTLKSTRDSHYRTHNPGSNRDFNCSVCNFYFCSKSSLKTHMLRHTGAKPFQCHICPAKFRTSGHRKSHVENHLKKADMKMSKAQLDVNKFLNALNAENEAIADNSYDQQDTRIETNNFDAAGTIQLTIPENSAECINMDPLLQQLQNGVLLLNDIQTDNNSVVTQNLLQFDIDCGEDNLPLVNIQTLDGAPVLNLNRPTETETNAPRDSATDDDAVAKKPFKCDICSKRYLKRFLLNKHLKTHGLNLPFCCVKCNKGFASAELLDKHVQSHFGQRPYGCQLCSNSFGDEGSLKIHIKRIHTL